MSRLVHRLTKPLHRGWGLWRIAFAHSIIRERGEKHGYANYAASKAGKWRMQAAAWRMPPAPATGSGVGPLEVHFLTGRAHWYQTIFCARSLIHHAPHADIRPVVHDDGTLQAAHVDRVLRTLPNARVVGAEEKRLQVDEVLPVSRFPVLREQGFSYPLFRKLHLHAAAPGWKLFLDSDMLFYRTPARLIAWLRSPDRPCHLVDAPGDHYGYRHSALEALAGRPVPARVNTGVVGLNREAVDWERVEFWARSLIDRGPMNPFVEQTLTAMLFAHTSHEPLCSEDYIVTPDREETLQPRAVMHHYTGTSRPWYFRFAWRRVLRMFAERR